MPTSTETRIKAFLSEGPYAVVGASADREKYGNKVLRCYQQNKLEVFPINPKAPEVEGLAAHASLEALAQALATEVPARKVVGISVITPPKVTEAVVQEAIQAGVKRVWMQPGAESPEAIRAAEAAGLEVIADGSCLLVALHFQDH
jgi:uncharacterized protein